MANPFGRSIIVALTNKSGGSVVAGDVVILDSANNDAFTTTTSASVTTPIGIAQQAIASNAVGLVLLGGYASLVNVNASVTRLHYGATYTVAKQATDAGASRVAGTFCVFLTSGATPDAYVYPVDLAGAALTNPMTTPEDIIKGGTAGAPTRLAVGAAGGALSVINAAVAWNSGTSFPGSKATGDRYWRTDLGLEAYWDGTRWLTTNEYTLPWTARTLLGFTASSNIAHAAVDASFDPYVTKVTFVTFVVTTNTGSHYWTVGVSKSDSAGTLTSIASAATSADTANTHTTHEVTVNAVVARATYVQYQFVGNITAGAPGALYTSVQVKYRLVLT